MKLEIYGLPETSSEYIRGFILYGGKCNNCRDAQDEESIKGIQKLEREGYSYRYSIDLGFFGDPYGKDERDPLYPYHLISRITEGCTAEELTKIMKNFEAYYLKTIETSGKALGMLDELRIQTK